MYALEVPTLVSTNYFNSFYVTVIDIQVSHSAHNVCFKQKMKQLKGNM